MRKANLQLTAASLLAIAAAASTALAQGQAPVASACKDDIPKVCAGVTHGGGRMRSCLESNKDKVSEACKTALDTHGPGKGMGQGGAKGAGSN